MFSVITLTNPHRVTILEVTSVKSVFQGQNKVSSGSPSGGSKNLRVDFPASRALVPRVSCVLFPSSSKTVVQHLASMVMLLASSVVQSLFLARTLVIYM